MGKRNARVQGEQNDQAFQEGQQAAAAAAPAATAPAGGGISAEDTARLAELGKLHDQGILTDAEFSQEKAKILGL
jgi:Short C-terminal domain